MKGIVIVVLLLTTSLCANTYDVFKDLFQELNQETYPIHYLIQATQKLDKVKFMEPSGDASTIYYPKKNFLYLPSFLATQGKLNKFSELQMHIGILYHELWHVFFHTTLKKDSIFMQRFLQLSHYHYPALYPTHKIEALEETYGTFLERLLTHFYFIKLYPNSHVPSIEEIASYAYQGYYNDSSTNRVVFVQPIKLTGLEKEWIFKTLLENKVQ